MTENIEDKIDEKKTEKNVSLIATFAMDPYEARHARREKIGLEFMQRFYEENGMAQTKYERTLLRDETVGTDIRGNPLTVSLKDDPDNRCLEVRVEYTGSLHGKEIVSGSGSARDRGRSG